MNTPFDHPVEAFLAAWQLGDELSRPNKSSYVYIMIIPGNDTYKIGRALNPLSRSRQCTRTEGYEHQLIWYRECKDYVAYEGFIHGCMSPFRIWGEYYDLPNDFVHQINCQLPSDGDTSYSRAA